MALVQLLVLILFFNNTQALKSIDLCFKTEKQTECIGDTIECGVNLCSISHDACQSYNTLMFILKTENRSKDEQNHENTLGQMSGKKRAKKRLQIYNRLLDAIKYCK